MPLFPPFCCAKSSDRREKGKKRANSWRIFSLKELHAATNSFNYDNKLGEGGFGSIYWGQLSDGTQVAVKRLKVWSDKEETEFSPEMEILGRAKHKNLLTLRGSCAEAEERLIVYEFMPNSSLFSHLHGQNSSDSVLDWPKRMKIANGIAEGILHLHQHASPPIIHGNIKSSNVLLDSEFQAQVADFGLFRLIPEPISHVKGTLNYLAPEYSNSGKVSESCDVYSFGVLLLEIVSGKKPTEKLDWAVQLARERNFAAVADPRLGEEFSERELKKAVIVALACTLDGPDKRPTMVRVLGLLKSESEEDLERLFVENLNGLLVSDGGIEVEEEQEKK